jgi:hypothetical protein
MNLLTYLTIFLAPAAFALLVIFYLLHRKNAHTELYIQGLRNENNGCYSSALLNYEDALSEIRKLGVKDRFSVKIAERMKVLRSTMAYEKNFQQ